MWHRFLDIRTFLFCAQFNSITKQPKETIFIAHYQSFYWFIFLKLNDDTIWFHQMQVFLSPISESVSKLNGSVSLHNYFEEFTFQLFQQIFNVIQSQGCVVHAQLKLSEIISEQNDETHFSVQNGCELHLCDWLTVVFIRIYLWLISVKKNRAIFFLFALTGKWLKIKSTQCN